MPKIIDHDERRAHIMDVTLNRIRREGFAGATMREIAAEAGFANGSLKHYFPNKDAIILATWERELERQLRSIDRAVQGKHGLEALREMSLAVAPSAAQDRAAGRVMLSFWELSLSSPRLYERYREHLQCWKRDIVARLDEARANAELDTTLSDTEIAEQVILLTTGATVLDQIGVEETSPTLSRDTLARFLDGLRREAD